MADYHTYAPVGAPREPKAAPRPLCLECMSRVCKHFDGPPVHLTPHLVRIVQCLTRGLSNKEIAAELHLAEGSVKEYVSDTFHVLGLTCRLEVGLWGLQHAAELAGGSVE